jgi:nitroreductase
MDTFEAIRTVLATRQFRDTPLSDHQIHRIVEAGRLTASSRNGQPWHFIVVQNKDTLHQLGTLARTGPYIPQAPVAIVVATSESPFAVSDASRAIQSMILAAWSEGIGSNWVGFHGRLDDVKSLLDIPADMDVQAILPFGYPAVAKSAGKKNRKPLVEVASRERFGQPFS